MAVLTLRRPVEPRHYEDPFLREFEARSAAGEFAGLSESQISDIYIVDNFVCNMRRHAEAFARNHPGFRLTGEVAVEKWYPGRDGVWVTEDGYTFGCDLTASGSPVLDGDVDDRLIGLSG